MSDRRLSTPEPGGAPLSREQLEHFANESRRAARIGYKEGARRQSRNAVIGFLILLAGVGYNSYETRHQSQQANRAIAMQSHQATQTIVASGSVVAVDGCNRDYRDDVRFTRLLQRLQAASNLSYKLGKTTKDQHDFSIAFYRSEIAKSKQSYPDCRKAQNVVTANPSELLPTLVPLHPPDPPAKGANTGVTVK